MAVLETKRAVSLLLTPTFVDPLRSLGTFHVECGEDNLARDPPHITAYLLSTVPR
jgi:hypothetical protein